MKREDKVIAINQLKEKISESNFFYLADSSELNVEQVNTFRGLCFEKGIEMKVVKNTLIKKALESLSEDGRYDELYGTLKGPTSVMFTDTANLPAKVIEEFRKSHDKPLLKAAYNDSSVYIGDEVLKDLAALKSKEELIGEIVALLQSPAKNVVSAP